MAGNAIDRRTRKFSEVIVPQPPRLKLTNRGTPPPQNLGPLQNLVGCWMGQGTGWNMIALPFHGAPAPPAGFKFRVLMNQYNEELTFTFVDDDVPNRGLLRPGQTDFDQFRRDARLSTKDSADRCRRSARQQRTGGRGWAANSPRAGLVALREKSAF